MQAVLEQNSITTVEKDRDSFGNKIGIFGKLFGCWHKSLSRPFTNDRSSYRACLDCGARRRFDTQNFKTLGGFYFPHR